MTNALCSWEPDGAGQFGAADPTHQSPAVATENRSALHRFRGDYTWEGSEVEPFRNEGACAAPLLRSIIIGKRGESCPFYLRYFEMPAGGLSSPREHDHEHVVVCVRGKGKAQVGSRSCTLSFLDTLYISPATRHQLANAGDEPFGYFCIVPREVGRLQELLGDELQWLQQSVASR